MAHSTRGIDTASVSKQFMRGTCVLIDTKWWNCVCGISVCVQAHNLIPLNLFGWDFCATVSFSFLKSAGFIKILRQNILDSNKIKPTKERLEIYHN